MQSLHALWAANSQTRIGFNAAYVKAIFTDYDNAPCYYPDSIAITIPRGCVQRVTNGVTNLVWPSLNGRPLPNAPRFKFNVSAERRVHVALPYDVVLGGSDTDRDSAEMLPDQNPRAIMPSVGILNFNLGLVSRSGKISVTAFVDNVTNKHSTPPTWRTSGARRGDTRTRSSCSPRAIHTATAACD